MARNGVVFCLGAVCGSLVAVGGAGVLLWRWCRHGSEAELVDDTEWTEEMVDTWVEYHYAEARTYAPFSCISQDALDFPLKCAQLCKRVKSDSAISRALDVGCATGRMSFELATAFDEVIGIDIAELCIKKANELKQNGSLTYKISTEGNLTEEHQAVVNPDIDRSRVTFLSCDANSLPEVLGQFGLVLITNTFCHLPDPMKFLEDMKQRIVPAGILVIVDFYGWDEMLKLPKDRWIAGYEDENGEKVGGFEGLKRVLSSHFDLLEDCDMQCLIRFSPRMYSLQIDHVTVWKRKSQ